MLTRRGWIVGIGSIIAAGAGRLFGIGEFMVMAVAGLSLVAIAVTWTRTRRVRLRIQRFTQPIRVHAGGTARVELAVTNLGGPTPVLQLVDPVTGTTGAHTHIGPLTSAERVQATYLLPTERRGRLDIGPADVAVVDPLGMARMSLGTGPRTTLMVYPATVALTPPRLARGPEPLGVATELSVSQSIGEDFYALRDYTAGDDVRRIHWPSTARLGRPMVREDEIPRRSRVTVMVDTRSSAFDPERFEVAVSAAASVVMACASRRDPLRLLTVAGADTGFVNSGEGLAQIFDYLAEVATSPEGSLRKTLAAATAASVGALVVVLGGVQTQADSTQAKQDAEAVAAAAARPSALSVIRVHAPDTSLPTGGNGWIDITNTADLSSKWAASASETRLA